MIVRPLTTSATRMLLRPRQAPSATLSRAVATVSWSQHLSFASPESDFCGNGSHRSSSTASDSSTTIQITVPPPTQRNPSWSQTLSFASPESDFSSSLSNVKALTQIHLPRTLQEALRMPHQAVVVTTAAAPHKIVYVNDTWQDLCGYSDDEAVHQPIGKLLQGPQTNGTVARTMTQQLLSASNQVDAYLVNYKASGQAFINHITAGPLYLDDSEEKPSFLVGILEEVSRENVPLRMVV